MDGLISIKEDTFQMKDFFSLLDRNKKFFLLTLLVGIVYSAIGVAIPTISGQLITSVVADSANRTILLCIFLLISCCQICFAELDGYVGNTLKIRQKKQMRKNAFHAFSAHDSAKREDISAFVSFVNNDIPILTDVYAHFMAGRKYLITGETETENLHCFVSSPKLAIFSMVDKSFIISTKSEILHTTHTTKKFALYFKNPISSMPRWRTTSVWDAQYPEMFILM